MTESMTAFARAEYGLEDAQLVWEVRSVNHRYLDINLKLPDEFRACDTRFRQLISSCLNRGRIDALLKMEPCADINKQVNIDQESLQTLLQLIKAVESSHPSIRPASATDILRWPGVIRDTQIDVDSLHEHGYKLLETTLGQLSSDRQREGGQMAQLILDRIEQCQKLTVQLSNDLTEIQAMTREKWIGRIQEIAENQDPDRIAQEIAIILTKTDVAEELDRLQTHFKEVERLLNQDKPVGRRLDFLMQELNREANTLGSKSVDEKMTNTSIELKVFIEQMREQIQNIE